MPREKMLATPRKQDSLATVVESSRVGSTPSQPSISKGSLTTSLNSQSYVKRVFGGALVRVLVGPTKQCYNLSRDLLIDESDYFRACLTGRFKEAQNQEVWLDDDEPEVFEQLIQFMSTGRVVFPESKSETSTPLTTRDLRSLNSQRITQYLKYFNLEEKLLMNGRCSYSMLESFARLLDSASNKAVTKSHIRLVYQLEEDHALRKIMSHHLAMIYIKSLARPEEKISIDICLDSRCASSVLAYVPQLINTGACSIRNGLQKLTNKTSTAGFVSINYGYWNLC